MHHGLPRSTHAGLNKLHLHLAVTSGTCSVPPSILDIEADLREKHMRNYGEDMEVYTEDHGPKKDHESDRPCLNNIDLCSSLSAQGETAVEPGQGYCQESGTCSAASPSPVEKQPGRWCPSAG